MLISTERGFKRYRPYNPQHTVRNIILLFVKIVVIWFIVYQAVTHFLFTPYTVASASMKPEFSEHDRVIASALMYGSRIPFSDARLPAVSPIQRGDAIVCYASYYHEDPLLIRIFDPVVRFFTAQQLSLSPSRDKTTEKGLILKRVIGLPGDSVMLKDFTAYVKPKGTDHFLTEFEVSASVYNISKKELPKGWKESFPFSGNAEPVTLGADEYYVLGDNRFESGDSRFFGPIDSSAIMGKVIFRYWPIQRFGVP